jgi:hypothetical protein
MWKEEERLEKQMKRRGGRPKKRKWLKTYLGVSHSSLTKVEAQKEGA